MDPYQDDRKARFEVFVRMEKLYCDDVLHGWLATPIL